MIFLLSLHNYPCIIPVLCLNTCPDCYRSLLMLGTIAKQTVLSESTSRVLTPRPITQVQDIQEGKVQRRRRKLLCLIPVYKTYLMDSTNAPLPRCPVSFLISLPCAQYNQSIRFQSSCSPLKLAKKY